MLLFGIPHKGLVVDDIQKILAHQENSHRSALLQQIRKESDLLESQLVDFKNLIRDRKVVSFYETRTPVCMAIQGELCYHERLTITEPRYGMLGEGWRCFCGG